jgi:uncharacterized DUF497 family protein
VHFEWDDEKNKSNVRKHGFDFTDAWEIFEAPMLTGLDEREDYGEDRWIGIGLLRGRIIVVVFTERDVETIRVISLRKASRHERIKYEEAITDGLGTN